MRPRTGDTPLLTVRELYMVAVATKFATWTLLGVACLLGGTSVVMAVLAVSGTGTQLGVFRFVLIGGAIAMVFLSNVVNVVVEKMVSRQAMILWPCQWP